MAPVNSPYVTVSSDGLAAGASATIVLHLTLPANDAGISDSLVPFSTSGTP
jgi:hypothetical protein